jgi:hypothetical protein
MIFVVELADGFFFAGAGHADDATAAENLRSGGTGVVRLRPAGLN